jgi:hypothetical protein
MDKNKLDNLFIDNASDYLDIVDFLRLDHSCNSSDNGYAKETLKAIHDIFVDAYGTYSLDYDHEYVTVPAVIRGRESGHIGIGLVILDLTSSGEHWGTFFFTPLGVINQGSQKIAEKESRYLSDTYGAYDYWYTVEIADDIHVDFDEIPYEISEMISYCCPEQQGMKME